MSSGRRSVAGPGIRNGLSVAMQGANMRRNLPTADRVPTISLMPAKERWDLVALNCLCKGCLTPGHVTTVRACPFRDELDDLCARSKCNQAHHHLLHVEGGPGPRRHPQPGQAINTSRQHEAQAVAAAVQLEPQPAVQLVTQRIRTAAGTQGHR